METLLERQRHAHEEVERLEQAIADRFLANPRTVRDRLQLDHETAEMLEKIQLRSHGLKELYADHDGSRALEIANLSAVGGLETFYTQLSSVRDYHRRYPDNVVEDLAAQYALRLPEPTLPVDPEDRITKMFSGEEAFGRHLDLIALHSEFVNLKRNKPISYARYIDIFGQFGENAFPKSVKDDPRYRQYLEHLLHYLESFHRRTQPLEDHNLLSETLDKEFEAEWASKQPDGIWCAICQKMYSKQTVYEGHLDSKKHKAGLKAQEVNGASKIASQARPSAVTDSKSVIAKHEFLISKFAQKLGSSKTATKSNIARKQTLTDKEWQAEQMEENLALLPTLKATREGADEGADSDSDEDAKIYNPLNLPLSWDGKPIPYWLYRLHGLGVEFPCEICGNYTYKGRKAFDRHFTEPRHLHGLTCLGIQAAGTSLYDGVVLINDALALLEKHKIEQRKLERKRDENVEMEDDSGNVMTEKVYNDLVAQGIL